MSLQSRDSRPKNRPDAQQPGASPDHRVHVPTSAERRRIRKARARRRVLATLTASLLVATALTAGAFIFPDTTAEVLKVVDLVKPSAGWTAMFPEKSAPAPLATAANEKPLPRTQSWRTAAQQPAGPGPAKPAAAYPTETASVSAAKPRMREFDWLPESSIEAPEANANASKLRAMMASADAVTASVTLAAANGSPASKPGAGAHAADATQPNSAARPDDAQALTVRTVTTTTEAGVVTAPHDAPEFKLNAVATAPTAAATTPEAPAHDIPMPDGSAVAAAPETAPLPDTLAPTRDSAAPLSTPAAETTIAATTDTLAPDTAAASTAALASATAALTPDAAPVVVATLATPLDTPASNLGIKSGVVPTSDAPPATTARAPATAKGPPAAEVAELIKRSRARLDLGDIAGARLLLERAASGSDPNALMALAETYDPAMLTRLGVRGPKGDPAKARELYERAAESGAPEASMRVLALR